MDHQTQDTQREGKQKAARSIMLSRCQNRAPHTEAILSSLPTEGYRAGSQETLMCLIISSQTSSTQCQLQSHGTGWGCKVRYSSSTFAQNISLFVYVDTHIYICFSVSLPHTTLLLWKTCLLSSKRNPWGWSNSISYLPCKGPTWVKFPTSKMVH